MTFSDLTRIYLDIADVIIIVIDPSQKVTFINRKGCELLGRKPREIIGKNWFDNFIPKEGRIRTKRVFNKIMRGKIKAVKYFENPIVDKKGAVRLIEWHNTVQKGADGRILATISSGVDVTEKKKNEAVLRENEENERFLTEIQAVAGLGTYVWDLSKNLWTSSKILDDIFGINESYVRSFEGWKNLIHPEWKETMGSYVVNEVLGKRKRFDKEYKIVRKSDGQELWVHGMGRLEFDEEGKPVKLIGTITDINNRKQIEEDVKESEKKYRLLADNVTDIIWMIDKDLKYTYISPSVFDARNLRPKEYIGKSMKKMVSPETWEKLSTIFPKKIEQALAGNPQGFEPFLVEENIKYKNGNYMEYESKTKVVLDESNKPIGFVGATRDTSERKKIEAQLIQSQKMEAVGQL
ncbi:MAG: PAS domain S-box protein, partial [Candidatus Firestonebacteria bacterium]